MADNILIIDDDALMYPGLAVGLERVGYLSSTASAAEALALIQERPPEMIFLTARRAKLDQVLRQELGADGNVGQPFDWGERLAHVKAIGANQLASTAARWRQIWVSAAFAFGVLLLVLAASQWMGWVQNIATARLPAVDTQRSWLLNGLFDPATTFNTLLSQTVQAWLNPSEQMDMLTTLAIIVLAVASVAGLAQLLGDKHTIEAMPAVPVKRCA